MAVLMLTDSSNQESGHIGPALGGRAASEKAALPEWLGVREGGLSGRQPATALPCLFLSEPPPSFSLPSDMIARFCHFPQILQSNFNFI